MANGKNNILVYRDWHETFRELTDEEAGQLIKHFFAYVNDENPKEPNRLIELLFKPIKAQLKRDLKKWESRCEINRENGLKGGRPKKTKWVSEKPNGLKINPKKPDTDTDKDKDMDINKINSRKIEFSDLVFQFQSDYNPEMLQEFIDYWTEHGIKDRKMRFEKEKSFSVSLRLKRWFKNQTEWKKEKSSGKKEKRRAADIIKEIKYGSTR